MLNDTQALPPPPLPAQSAHDPAEHRSSIESTVKVLAPGGARLARFGLGWSGAADAAQPLLSLSVPSSALSIHYPYPSLIVRIRTLIVQRAMLLKLFNLLNRTDTRRLKQ